MTKRREKDPELESLLRAFREVHPTVAETNRWRDAIAEELRELSPASPKSENVSGGRVYRFALRTLIPVGVAAGLGLVLGAAFIERRLNQDSPTMLFSQLEATDRGFRPPATMDEQREVVRINLDAGNP